MSEPFDRNQIRRDAEDTTNAVYHPGDTTPAMIAILLADHCLALLDALAQAEYGEREAMQEGDRLYERVRALDAQLTKVPGLLRALRRFSDPADWGHKNHTATWTFECRYEHPAGIAQEGTQWESKSLGDRKRRRAERETGLTIDRLVKLDNRTWEARVLTDSGHQHVAIAKDDWSTRPSHGYCWTTCGGLPQQTRTREPDGGAGS